MLSAAEIVGALEHQTKEERLTVVPWPERDELLRKGETSIDLRLGRWFRSFKQTRTPSVSLVGRIPRASDEPSETSRTKQHFVPFGSNYVLHPGRFVLGVTLEWLRLPASLSGYVTGKSSLGRHGLVIETAAGIHPQFSGCLTLELANVGEVPLEIYPGMPICQIFLHRTQAGEEREPDRFSGRRKPMLSPPKADETFMRLVDSRPDGA